MDVTCTCGVTFQARSAKARYCSDRCRKRKRKADVIALATNSEERPALDVARGPVEKSAFRELEDAGRLNSTVGQACLALARRLDAPGLDTGSAMSSVAARLDDLLAKATKGAGAATSPQQLRDELAARRQRHA